MTEMVFVELHSPLFLGGKNHGIKLHKKPDLKLEYDEKEKELIVTFQNRKGRLPSSSVFSMEEDTVQVPVPPVNEHATMDTNKIKSAQVSTPMGHVFEGPGKGKTK